MADDLGSLDLVVQVDSGKLSRDFESAVSSGVRSRGGSSVVAAAGAGAAGAATARTVSRSGTGLGAGAAAATIAPGAAGFVSRLAGAAGPLAVAAIGLTASFATLRAVVSESARRVDTLMTDLSRISGPLQVARQQSQAAEFRRRIDRAQELGGSLARLEGIRERRREALEPIRRGVDRAAIATQTVLERNLAGLLDVVNGLFDRITPDDEQRQLQAIAIAARFTPFLGTFGDIAQQILAEIIRSRVEREKQQGLLQSQFEAVTGFDIPGVGLEQEQLDDHLRALGMRRVPGMA